MVPCSLFAHFGRGFNQQTAGRFDYLVNEVYIISEVLKRSLIALVNFFIRSNHLHHFRRRKTEFLVLLDKTGFKILSLIKYINIFQVLGMFDKTTSSNMRKNCCDTAEFNK